MARKIKIDKKKLKEPDEFISWSSRLVNYLTENWKIAVIALIIIFGGLGIYSGTRYYKSYVNAKNQEKIATALASFRGEKGKEAEAIVLLEKVAKRSGGRATGLISRLYLGNHFFKQAIYDRALEEYESILSANGNKVDPLVLELALLGAGYSFEQLRKYPEAIVRFKEVADNSASIFGDSALISAARCYEQQGDLKAAAELYKRVEAEHPDSPYLSEVRARLEEIEPSKAAPSKQ